MKLNFQMPFIIYILIVSVKKILLHSLYRSTFFFKWLENRIIVCSQLITSKHQYFPWKNPELEGKQAYWSNRISFMCIIEHCRNLLADLSKTTAKHKCFYCNTTAILIIATNKALCLLCNHPVHIFSRRHFSCGKDSLMSGFSKMFWSYEDSLWFLYIYIFYLDILWLYSC